MDSIISLRKIPEDERSLVWLIQMKLGDLDQRIKEFGAALSICDFADAQLLVINNAGKATTLNLEKLRAEGKFHQGIDEHWRRRESESSALWLYHGWKNVAGRDACMTLTHFKDCLESLKHNIQKSPTLRPIIMPVVEATLARFSAEFPDYREIRDAVAHVVDLNFNREKQQKHSASGDMEIPGLLKGKNSTVQVMPQIIGRNFAATRNGKTINIELLTPKVLNIFQELQTELRRAFERVQAELKVVRKNV